MKGKQDAVGFCGRLLDLETLAAAEHASKMAPTYLLVNGSLQVHKVRNWGRDVPRSSHQV